MPAPNKIFSLSLIHEFLERRSLLQFIKGLDVSCFEELEQSLRRHDRIAQCAVTVFGELQVELLDQYVQIMAELGWVNALAQAHGAETLGKIDVAPAELFLVVQKSVVELCIVREQDRPLGVLQELRQDFVYQGRGLHVFIANLIHLASLQGDVALGIHERHKRLLWSNDAVLQTHSRNLNDPVPASGV